MAKAKFKMKGVNKFMKSFNNEVRGIQNRTHAGLINAVIVLQRAAYDGTPKDTANLVHSWFTVSYKTPGNLVSAPGGETFKGSDAGKMKSDHNKVKQAAHSAAKRLGSVINPVLLMGYSANYATWVHEADPKIDFTKHGNSKATRRWFYKALQDSRAEMLEEIRKSAQIR